MKLARIQSNKIKNRRLAKVISELASFQRQSQPLFKLISHLLSALSLLIQGGRVYIIGY